MINNLKIIGTYLFLVIIFFFVQVFLGEYLGLTVSKDLIIKLYLIIGLLTLFFIIIGLIVKKFNHNHVGSVFLAGMVAKMAVVLALVVVNQQIKEGVYQLMIAYFLILIAEVLTFVRLLRSDL